MLLQNLQEAQSLNTAGASMLAKNNRKGAVRAFKTAVQIMESVSMSPEADGKIRSNQEQPCGAMGSMPSLDDSFYVYNQPLLFHVLPQAIDMGFYNGIIMFNLALVFHQEAVFRGDFAKFQKAKNLYQLCINLMTGDKTAASGAVILAAMNNSVHASLRLGAYDDFRSGIENLTEQAAAVSTQKSTAPTPFERMHLEEFYLNITLASEPTTAPVA